MLRSETRRRKAVRAASTRRWRASSARPRLSRIAATPLPAEADEGRDSLFFFRCSKSPRRSCSWRISRWRCNCSSSNRSIRSRSRCAARSRSRGLRRISRWERLAGSWPANFFNRSAWTREAFSSSQAERRDEGGRWPRRTLELIFPSFGRLSFVLPKANHNLQFIFFLVSFIFFYYYFFGSFFTEVRWRQLYCCISLSLSLSLSDDAGCSLNRQRPRRG